jgi:hypothetical protein
MQNMNVLVKGARRLLDILQLDCRKRTIRIEKDSDQCCGWNQLAQQTQPLAFHLGDKQVYSRDVTFRTVDQAKLHGTMGIALVAVLAASAVAEPRVATISATLRRTRSSANTGKRSYSPAPSDIQLLRRGL